MTQPPDIEVEIAVEVVEGSSNIARLGWHPGSKTLEVQFKNGGIYRYGDVTAEDARTFMSAPSKGRHLREFYITNQSEHPFERMQAQEVRVQTLVTIGYARRTAPQLRAKLLAAEVATVIDVRGKAAARARPDMSARKLLRLLAPEIEYKHMPALAIPAPGDDLSRAWERYFAALSRLCVRLETETVALLSTERNAARSHRWTIAKDVQQAGPGVQVRHIE